MDKLHALLVYQTALGPLWAVLVSLVAVPLANEIVQRSKGTRAQSLLQGIASFVLKLPAVGALIARIPALGDALYILAPQDKTGLPKPLLYKPKVTAGDIVANTNASLRMLVPFLLVGAMLSGCPVPAPIPTNLDGGAPSYLTSFEACLKNDGITDATNLGAQILQILNNGGSSAQGIESAIEQVLVTAGGQGAILVATCAVDAYDAANPVATKAKPTPPQAAIRLFRAKHMVAPTVHHG